MNNTNNNKLYLMNYYVLNLLDFVWKDVNKILKLNIIIIFYYI